MPEEEPYWKYLARRDAEEHNIKAWIEQLGIALPPLIFGGLLLAVTTSGAAGEVPLCTSAICIVQAAALIYAVSLSRHYKKG